MRLGAYFPAIPLSPPLLLPLSFLPFSCSLRLLFRFWLLRYAKATETIRQGPQQYIPLTTKTPGMAYLGPVLFDT